MQRLAVLPVFGLTSGHVRVLDVGAGTGAMCLDMAWACGPQAQIMAVDSDGHSVALLQEMASMLGCGVESRLGEAYCLPVESSSQDLTVSRFLFQHLDRPALALDEMVRVTAPGGRVAVMEVDDGAWLSHPAEASPLERLNDAVRRLQASTAAGRHVGRQLYQMFRSSGLIELQILAVPRVRLGTYYGRNAELEMHQKEYYLNYREPLIAAGLITVREFDDAMLALEQSFSNDDFGFACEFLAMGRVPPSAAN
ncbi:MAG: methyltransferase domain-containing protein [Gammaproteobacteria bacterium]